MNKARWKPESTAVLAAPWGSSELSANISMLEPLTDMMLLRANKVYMMIILIEHYWRHRLPEVTLLVVVKGAVCKILVEKHLKN